jgi:opacity protein-like surface antigen
MGSFRGVTAASFIALVVATVPAVGDDGRRPAAFDQPYYSAVWNGLYGGVNVGWGWSGDASGAVGGGQIGYNWQSNQFVYGLEADISAADIGISEKLVVPGAVLNASASIGLLLQPNLLVYGTAGLAVVNAEAHASVAAFGMGEISARESDTETGSSLESVLRASSPRECRRALSTWNLASPTGLVTSGLYAQA